MNQGLKISRDAPGFLVDFLLIKKEMKKGADAKSPTIANSKQKQYLRFGDLAFAI